MFYGKISLFIFISNIYDEKNIKKVTGKLKKFFILTVFLRLRKRCSFYIPKSETVCVEFCSVSVSFHAFLSRSAEKLAAFLEPGSMAWAVPCSLSLIPFQGASHMRAAFLRKIHKIDYSLSGIDRKRWMKHAS